MSRIYWCLGILIGGFMAGIGSVGMFPEIVGFDVPHAQIGLSALVTGIVIAVPFMAGACTKDRCDHDH